MRKSWTFIGMNRDVCQIRKHIYHCFSWGNDEKNKGFSLSIARDFLILIYAEKYEVVLSHYFNVQTISIFAIDLCVTKRLGEKVLMERDFMKVTMLVIDNNAERGNYNENA